jgi:hypothetical protein
MLMTNLVKKGPENDQATRSSGGEPEVGRWYWVTETDSEKKVHRVLRCVTHVGTNYVELKGPSIASEDGVSSIRVHFDGFWEWCEHVEDPDVIINGEIERYKEKSKELMGEVRALTAKLGVAPRQQISDGGDDVQALSVRSAEPTDAYKKALVKAKTKTLPDLFEKLKQSNSKLGQWMKVKLIPMSAEAEALKGVVGLVEDRIFSVELYAGLVEQVKLVQDGQPADNDAKVHIFQRRCYMDEECLVGYEHGGMDYQNIEDFEGWLTKPANFARLFPFPRTLVAFKVRREKKDRVVTLRSFIRVMGEQQADEQTYLYIRNGERLYRMQTELEFEEKLFPDTNHKIFTSTKLWSKWAGSSVSMDDIISDEEYQGIVEDEKLDEAEKAAMPKADRWKHSSRHFHSSSSYTAFTPESVYYDDIAKIIAKEKKKHNRLVLIMQGLLDRSPVLHPHPPYQLWTPEGFGTAFKLIYDDTRALSAGDKPDFEAYRAKLNAFLAAGSLTVGQETSWLMREADRENERRANMHSFGSSSSYDRPDLVTYKPDGDPGPGKLAHVARYDAKEGRCTYAWTRQKRTRNGWAVADSEVPAKLVTGEENVLNVDAYKPGDFHIFFDDPRTRREYLEWAPLLLEAEECHAGNRKEFKPARALPPSRTPVVRTEERPVDLDVPKKREPQESLSEKWKGRKVRLLHAMTTKGGTSFKKGELMEVDYYERRKLSLTSLDDPGEKGDRRSIRSVGVDEVEIVAEREKEKEEEGECTTSED